MTTRQTEKSEPRVARLVHWNGWRGHRVSLHHVDRVTIPVACCFADEDEARAWASAHGWKVAE